jgi:hypothetical protein
MIVNGRKEKDETMFNESRARATRCRPTISKSREACIERALEYSMVTTLIGVSDDE